MSAAVRGLWARRPITCPEVGRLLQRDLDGEFDELKPSGSRASSSVPAAVGNMLGGSLLVALTFWYALRPPERARAAARSGL